MPRSSYTAAAGHVIPNLIPAKADTVSPILFLSAASVLPETLNWKPHRMIPHRKLPWPLPASGSPPMNIQT